ncbi:protein of unknown function [Thermomonospora echinospora]|uniref:DUF4407 domain-containing protein n=1 Tax=Thermomonospora echinospora TaxID=1992 RepID=A0A1H6DUD8_9ACTN|nr:DUF4407 domain-containing protein [Thermomonospora echinospora]SEG88849.1 protein of unknown function [Thermomonospora echinospora]
MKNVLVWLSSARADALELSPGDRPKHVGIGSAIVLTGAIAGVAMSYALTSAVKVPAAAAVAFGVAWAVGIMLLDRWLVASIQRGSLWQNILTAVPRFALAVLFGVVISTPLVLRVFEPEIAAEITRMHQADADTFQRQQREGDAGKAITDLTAQRDALQKTIASGGDAPSDPEADPEVIGLRSQLKEAQTARDKAVEQLDCQLYGPCKPTGPGPLADAARRALDTAEGRIRTINGQIEGRKRELSANDEASRAQRVADARAALPGVQARLADRVRQQENLRKQFEDRQRNSNGLLARIEALDRLSERDEAMRRAHLLLILLFTSIEILPVLVKLLMLFSPESNYERVVKEKEGVELDRARIKIRTGGSAEPGVDDALFELWNTPHDMTDGPPPKATTPLSADLDPEEERGGRPSDGPHLGDAKRLREMPDTHVHGYDGEGAGFDDGLPPADADRWDDADGWDDGAGDAGGTGAGFAPPPPADDGFATSRVTTVPDPGRRAGSSGRDDEADRLLEFDDE